MIPRPYIDTFHDLWRHPQARYVLYREGDKDPIYARRLAELKARYPGRKWDKSEDGFYTLRPE